MVTTPIAQLAWNKFARFPDEAWQDPEVVSLAARTALMIYRKEGRQAARNFINLITVCRVMAGMA